MHHIILVSVLVVLSSASPVPQVLPETHHLPATLQGVTSGVGVDPASLHLRARHILQARLIRNADFQSSPAPAPVSEEAPAPVADTDTKAQRASADSPTSSEPSAATSPDASKHDEIGKVLRSILPGRGSFFFRYDVLRWSLTVHP